MALDELDELYRDSIFSHVRNPRNHAVVPGADVTGESVNPFCGDEISLQLRLNDCRAAWSRVGLQGKGCSINRAAGSIMSEAIEGKSLDEIEALSALFRGMMRGREPAPGRMGATGRAGGALQRHAVPRAHQVRAAAVVGPRRRHRRVPPGREKLANESDKPTPILTFPHQGGRDF